MYIKNAIYKPVRIHAPLPLAEGTVITLGGNIANEDGSDAYGIVAQRVTNLPPSGKINIAVSGTIDLTENKVTFTDNMIHGLHEFNFVPYQESTGGGSFPTPTEDDNGKVLTAGADGTASWQTASGGGGEVVAFSTAMSTAILTAIATGIAALKSGSNTTKVEALNIRSAATAEDLQKISDIVTGVAAGGTYTVLLGNDAFPVVWAATDGSIKGFELVRPFSYEFGSGTTVFFIRITAYISLDTTYNEAYGDALLEKVHTET